jgi:cell division protein ZapE
MTSSFRAAYAERLSSGSLRHDAAQDHAVDALARLESELNAVGEPSLASFFKKPKAVRGVYLWGPVGRGKSMLMDLFFACAPVHRKQRIHFYAFMAEVHELIAAWRNGDAAARKARFGAHKGEDPIVPTAELLASRTRLLCFDELQVTDIADAMILGRLFEAMFAHGVTLVSTSNRPPDDLYKDGINRDLFLPFIDMLKQHAVIVALAGETDYRLDRLRGARAWFSPITKENEAAFDALWRDLLGEAGESGATVEVQGRKMRFPRAAGGLLRASFHSLCDQALGAQDYAALTERFHTLFLEDVPRLTPERKNPAARFRILVDTLYEAGTKLVVLAEAEPDGLHAQAAGAFEFERTVSRLEEMRSSDYLERVATARGD